MTKNGATGTLQYVFKVQVRLQMITGPLSTKKWEKSWEKSYFLIFQEVFRTRYGQFQVPNDPKWCLRYPQLGILMQWFVITGLLVHWAQKGGRNWDKSQKSHFLGSFQRWIWPFIGLKTVPIDQNWFFFGPGRSIGICKNVSKCLLMQSRQFKGPKLGQSKNSHFPADIHKVKSRIFSNGKCHPYPSTFETFLCIFLIN